MNKLTRGILLSIPLLAGGFFLWKYLSKKDEPKTDESKNDDLGIGTSSGASPSVFPLKKGSKGAKVTELQNILLSANPNILPKFGADGDFGSETETALLTLFNKSTIKNQRELDGLLKLIPERVYTKAELSAKSKSFVARQFMQRRVQTTQPTQVVTGTVSDFGSPIQNYRVNSYVDRPSGYIINYISLVEDTGTGLLYVIEANNNYQRVNPFHIKFS